METNNHEQFNLEPSWKHFFFTYVLSILAIPIVGLGLVALYLVREERKTHQYIITNFRITAIDEKYEHNVDLVDIEHIDLLQTSWQKRLGIGSLLLHTSASNMKLAGIEQPQKYKEILEQAITFQHKQQQQRPEIEEKQTEYNPGNRERINYLTGLWQQGLISEQEYKEEKKHFE